MNDDWLEARRRAEVEELRVNARRLLQHSRELAENAIGRHPLLATGIAAAGGALLMSQLTKKKRSRRVRRGREDSSLMGSLLRATLFQFVSNRLAPDRSTEPVPPPSAQSPSRSARDTSRTG